MNLVNENLKLKTLLQLLESVHIVSGTLNLSMWLNNMEAMNFWTSQDINTLATTARENTVVEIE